MIVLFAQILLLTGCIMVINGQLESRVGSPRALPRCASVRCRQPNCTNPITPRGECCEVCPTLPPQCAAVLCARPDCSNSIIPPGQCCPICPGSKPGICPRTIGFRICIDLCRDDSDCRDRKKCCSNGCGRICIQPEGGGGRCDGIECPQIRCANQYTPPGACCPICRTVGKCDGIRCPPVRCADPYTPPGECCPVCRPNDRPPICERVRCKRPIGCVDEYIPRGECCPVCGTGNKCHRVACRPLPCRNRYTPPGQCCPVCRRRPRPDCSRALCKEVSCRGRYIPLRRCCPVCPRYRY